MLSPGVIYKMVVLCLILSSDKLFSNFLMGQHLTNDSLLYKLEILYNTNDRVGFKKELKKIGDHIIETQNKPAYKLLETFIYKIGKKQNEDNSFLRVIYMRLGNVHSRTTNDRDESMRIYNIASSYLDESGCDDLIWYIENHLLNDYLKIKDYEKARQIGLKIEPCLMKTNDKEKLSRLYSNLGHAYRSLEQFEKAKAILNKGLDIANALNYALGIISNNIELAKLERRLKNTNQALSHIRQAELLLDKIKNEPSCREKKQDVLIEKSKLMSHSKNRIEDLSEVFNLAKKKNDVTFLRKYYYEKSKMLELKNKTSAILNLDSAISIMEVLWKNDKYVDPWLMNAYYKRGEWQTDKQLKLKDYMAAIHISSLIRNRLITSGSVLFSLEDNKVIVDRIIELIHKEYGDIDDENKEMLLTVRKVFNESKSLKLLFKRKQKINLDEKNQINNYVEYLLTDSSLFAISSINGYEKFTKVCSYKELHSFVKKLDTYLQQEEDEDTILMYGYNLLLDKIINSNVNEMIIIPDDLTALIPFDILVNRKGQYLIKNTKLSYKYFFTKDNNSGDIKSENVLCLAPVYRGRSGVLSNTKRNQLSTLRDNRMEAEKVSTILNSSVADYTNWSFFIQQLKKANIFHFAGHSIQLDSIPVLAMSDEINFSLHNIDSLNLQADLVVLSACETGFGKYEQGEGLASIGKYFYEAGVDHVVQSLWKANDESTAIIMELFYRNLKKGLTTNDALRQAKLDFFESAGMEMKHPYHWAAFVNYGHNGVMKSDNWNIYFLTLIIFVIIFLIIIKRNLI